MEFEPMDEFERELSAAMQRRPAPPTLKNKILARRARQAEEERRHRSMLWMKMAASLLIAAALGSGADWGIHKVQERRKGEEARRQVMIALRITGRELNQVQQRLVAHDRKQGEQ